MLDATLLRGENKDEPTRSILNVVPTKNDDGASYRCTVWNRALRQEHSLEAGTKIYVNCKYFSLHSCRDIFRWAGSMTGHYALNSKGTPQKLKKWLI